MDESHFFTSALSTAQFVSKQKPNGSAFVIGDVGLVEALTEVGYTLNAADTPDYVIVGETDNDSQFNFSRLKQAVNHVMDGAFLIGTNLDALDNAAQGYAPACGALCAPIEVATGVKTYYCGKPNPMMMSAALKKLRADKDRTILIGDRMDTDIVGGIESGIDTLLVFSGVCQRGDLAKYSYKPTFTLSGLFELIVQDGIVL